MLTLWSASLMMRYIATIATLCVLTALNAAPVPDDAKPQLLIVSKRSGNAEIYLVNIDGKGAKSLTPDKGENSYPAWSPDGKSIAFASDRDGTMNIYVMDATGRN